MISFQKRTNPLTGTKAMGIRILFFFMALIVLGLFFYLMGINPLELYQKIIDVNILLFPSTIGRFITLLCIAIGLAIPFKARIDNIGAEGQYIMGTIAATGTALIFSDLPSLVLIPLMFVNGFIIGAIWALPVVFFRVKGGFQGSDVVVSFLMVFPALYILEYLVSGPWRDPETGFTYSSQLPESARIPTLENIDIVLPYFNIDWNLASIHVTLFLVLALTALVYYFLFRYVNGIPKTKMAYEITVAGKNPSAGRTAGMSFFKVVLVTMILSGGFAAIAGVGEIAGNQLRLTPTSRGFGFTAIAVAYLGGLNPIGILFSSLFFAALIVGGLALKTIGLPGTSLDLFSGVMLLFVLVAEYFFRYTIKWRK